MPQISITIFDQDLVFLEKLSKESNTSRSEMARDLLRIGIRTEVQQRNAMAVYLSMEDKRVSQQKKALDFKQTTEEK